MSFFENNHKYFHFVFRVLVGFLFLFHGSQKLFGWPGDRDPVVVLSLMGFVGIVEFVGGLAIMLGFFTRLAAAGAAVVMVSAYFKSHAAQGVLPIVNRGELALLYFATFTMLIGSGATIWSLERALFGKELF